MIYEQNNKIIFKDIEDFKDLKIYTLLEDNKNRLYLILLESPLANSKQYNKKYHKYFQKILTWDDDLVDNIKYFKFLIPQLIYESYEVIPFAQKRTACIINSNKIGIDEFELYSKRKELILDFQCMFNDFDVYGVGWNKPQLKLMSFLHCGKNILKYNYKRLMFSFDYFFNIHKVNNYRDEVGGQTHWTISSKECIKVYNKYKFAICYENLSSKKGYISEKIFNCLNARCVPIYLGATNITDYIPSNCFVDAREFKTNRELINYIVAIEYDESIYNKYIENIEQFLKSEDVKKFSIDNYEKRINIVFGGEDICLESKETLKE